MPIHASKDKNGYYYQWGHAKKYYFNPKSEYSRGKAYHAAAMQARAIYSSGYKGK